MRNFNDGFRYKNAVFSVSLLAGIALSTTTTAQEVGALVDDNEAMTSAEKDNASSGGAPVIEQILVTAQRRQESEKDVPISLVVVTPDALARAGVSTTNELSKLVPSLNFSIKGSYPQPVLRGVSTQGLGIGLDPAVPIYLDGVYMVQPSSTVFDLADISSIQVLKGPQGTLYGRNATGGAILVTTRDPAFEPAANLSASYGSLDEVRLSGFATGALSEKLAVSVSGIYRRRDGYAFNIFTNERNPGLENYALRAKLRFRPTDKLEFQLSGYHIRVDDVTVFAAQSVLGLNSLSRLVDPSGPVSERPFETSNNLMEQALLNTTNGATLTGSLETSVGEFRSLTSYQHSTAKIVDDVDAGPATVLHFFLEDNRSESVSEEITFTSRDFGPFNFIVGGLYFHDDSMVPFNLNDALFINGFVETEALAAYAEANLNVTDRLMVSGGARYSHENRQYDGFFRPAPNQPLLHLVDDAKESWSDVTPRFSIRYALTNEVNVYGTYSRGFKSGAFSATGLSPAPVDPEKIRAFEVGVKGVFPWGRFNLAVFDYRMKNLQVSQLIQQPGGATSSQIANAASAESWGIDGTGSVDVGEYFTLTAGGAYVDGEYTDWQNAAVNLPIPAANCAAAGAPFPCGNFGASIDATGNPLLRSPTFTANATLEFHTPLAGGWLTASTTYYHTSGFAWEPANRIREDSYDTLAARISWVAPDDQWEVSVYGNNLTDEVYAFSEVDSVAGDTVSYAQPRSFGASVSFSY